MNPVDMATRAGVLAGAGLMTGAGQIGIGWDVAGWSTRWGPGYAFAVGDRVVGLSDRLDMPVGAQAELVVLDASAVARAPEVDPVAAATLPLNASTALQGLDLLGLTPGQTLLVTGAAGAVGGFAVELAAARGCGSWPRRVTATRSWCVAWARRCSCRVRRRWPRRFGRPSRAGWTARWTRRCSVLQALDAVRGGGAFVAVVAGGRPHPLRGIRVRNVMVRADGARAAGAVRAGDTGAGSPCGSRTRSRWPRWPRRTSGWRRAAYGAGW